MHTTHTLRLDDRWDVNLDAVGNLAIVRGDPYATAQNVANECRLFTRDAYFAYDRGIPHFVTELGQRATQTPALRSYLRRAGLAVPNVAWVTEVRIDDFNRETRALTGAITFTLRSGENVGIDL